MSDSLEENELLARWLDGRLSDDERKELEASGALNNLDEAMKEVARWKLPSYDAAQGFDQLQSKIKQPASKTKKIPLSSIWKYAAAAAVLLIAYFAIDLLVPTEQVRYALDAQETKQIELPDGSTVILDASSTLSYTPVGWPEKRSINLNGQAFFEVVKGSEFSVSTPTGIVKVLGTQFNVNSTEQGFTVVCYEGSVEVSNAASSHQLQPGEGVRMTESGGNVFTTTDPTPSWIQGDGSSVKYLDSPLLEVAHDLSRQYGIGCDLPEKYQTLRFSGIVPRNNLENALKTIFVPMEIPYTVNDEAVLFEP